MISIGLDLRNACYDLVLGMILLHCLCPERIMGWAYGLKGKRGTKSNPYFSAEPSAQDAPQIRGCHGWAGVDGSLIVPITQMPNGAAACGFSFIFYLHFSTNGDPATP